MTKVMRKEARHTQRRDRASGVPLEILEHTPVLLPGESHGGRSLVGYSPWGRKELDTTEQLHSLTQCVITKKTEQ